MTFADWLGQQMERNSIRSGRRLALETGLDEQAILDWAIGRRVPHVHEVDVLATFFRVPIADVMPIRDQSELALPSRARR
jgi:hypothetical protein